MNTRSILKIANGFLFILDLFIYSIKNINNNKEFKPCLEDKKHQMENS
jgi:hypothetical protein